MLRRSLQFFVSAMDIEQKLKSTSTLAPLAAVQVSDVSGGCGSFFKVEVTSDAFRDKTLLQQHRLVHDALKEEIAQIHGLTIVARAPQ